MEFVTPLCTRRIDIESMTPGDNNMAANVLSHTQPSFASRNAGSSPVSIGVWMHAGSFGVLAAAGGVAQLLDDPSRLGFAAALFVVGTACAAFAWRRLSAVLETLEEALPDAGRVTPTARSSSGASYRPIGGAHATA